MLWLCKKLTLTTGATNRIQTEFLTVASLLSHWPIPLFHLAIFDSLDMGKPNSAVMRFSSQYPGDCPNEQDSKNIWTYVDMYFKQNPAVFCKDKKVGLMWSFIESDITHFTTGKVERISRVLRPRVFFDYDKHTVTGERCCYPIDNMREKISSGWTWC